jgi:hypothetical protein
MNFLWVYSTSVGRSTSDFIVTDAERVPQVINYKRKYDIGSPLQILRRTTISHAETIMMALLNGSLKAARSSNGRRQAPSCGSMVNVCVCSTCFSAHVLTGAPIVAGSGKSILW